MPVALHLGRYSVRPIAFTSIFTLAAALAGCGPTSNDNVPDAGSDLRASDADAGTSPGDGGDAGSSSPDAGTLPAATDLTASTDIPTHIHLAWQAPSGSAPSGYVVLRDGVDFATVGAGFTTFDDVSTAPGSAGMPTSVTATQGTRGDAVEVTWTGAAPVAGASHPYTVVALYGADRGAASNTAVGNRAAPTITGYVVQRGGFDLATVAPLPTKYEDTSAAKGTVTAPSSVVATQGTRTDAVGLTWSAATTNAGPSYGYSVAALYDSVRTVPTTPAVGARGGPEVTGYIVQRDGASIATLASNTTTYDDSGASPGSPTVPANLTATAGTRTDGVGVSWSAAASSPGPHHAYTVTAVYDEGRSDDSLPSSGWRGPLPVTGYVVRRDGVDLVTLPADATAYLDLSAGLGSIAGTATVVWDPPRNSVKTELMVDAWSDVPVTITPGAAALYTVSATAGAITGAESTPGAWGYRGTGSDVSYQWQRSAADSDADYTDIPGFAFANGHDGTAPWGVGRYYRLVMTADGASGTTPPVRAISYGYKSISAGSAHTCAVRSDDKIVCWGRNMFNRPPSTDSFAAVASGGSFTCGIRTDGHLVCLDGTGPTLPTAAVYVGVSAGSGHLCAVRDDHRVLCWGQNDNYQAPAGPSTDSFSSISAGDSHTCGIRTDGSLACWGNSAGGRRPLTPVIDNFLEVAAGGAHTCALRADHKVTCWGPSTMPAPPTDSFDHITASTASTCGLRSDGTVRCWSVDGSPVSSPASAEIFTSIEGGGSHACGVRADGTARCWGPNSDGQAPSEPPRGKLTRVALGDYHSCGLRDDGKVVCWGLNFSGQAPPDPSADSFIDLAAASAHTCGIRDDHKVLCWGANSWGEAPAGPSADSLRRISTGDRFTCGIRDDGKIVCWGTNLPFTPSPTVDSFVDIAVASDHACAVRDDGAVVCSGYNSPGTAPTAPLPPWFTSVATGDYLSCGVHDDQSVECWGGGYNSPLGSFLNVSTRDRFSCGVQVNGRIRCWASVPDFLSPTSPDAFLSVQTGRSNACGIRRGGTIACWGSDTSQQSPQP